MNIIDTHTFLGKNDFLNLEYNVLEFHEVKDFYKDLYDLKFLITSASPEDNKNIANIVGDNPELFIGANLLIIPKKGLPWDYTSPDSIYDLAKNKYIVGLKFITSLMNIPIDHSLLDPFIDICKEFKLAGLYHCSENGDDYTSFDKIQNSIQKHPDHIRVLAHFSGLNINRINSNINIIYENLESPIYLNTTGFSGEMKKISNLSGKNLSWYVDLDLRKQWEQVLKNYMDDGIIKKRIIFGTDFPYLSHAKFPETYSFFPINTLKKVQIEQIYNNTNQVYKKR